MRTVSTTRYITPLREGGSLPALVEADDGGLYVLKFRGAGQGPGALIAELIAGELLRAVGLPVPELVFAKLDAGVGRSEGDPEIWDLLQASVGLNLAMAYLPSALAFDPLLEPPPAPDLASAVVWGDAYLTNVDRTPRNPNILLTGGHLWLIDHGACLYIHHTWNNYQAHSRSRFAHTSEHVLLPFASQLVQADAALSARLTPDLIRQVVDLVPDEWLHNRQGFETPAAHRAAYCASLTTRLQPPRDFVEEAISAYSKLI